MEWWRDVEGGDVVHGQSLGDKAAKAMAEMEQFASDGRCYVATSWGKDSVVVAHFAALMSLPLVNIWQAGPQHDPDVYRVRDSFLSMFPRTDYQEIVVDDTRSQRDDTERAPSLMVGIERAAAEYGRRYIGGIRADESGARKIRCRVGFLNTCQPIRWWSVADVFGWAAANNLPVHPAYAMTGGGRWSREHIRVSIIGGEKGRQFGRAEWEGEYYGDILRRMSAG